MDGTWVLICSTPVGSNGCGHSAGQVAQRDPDIGCRGATHLEERPDIQTTLDGFGRFSEFPRFIRRAGRAGSTAAPKAFGALLGTVV